MTKRVAEVVADHYGAVTGGVRAGLATADLVHGLVGTKAMQGALDGMRSLSGGMLPKWSPTLPRPINFRPSPRTPSPNADRVVYFPSCAARNMGAQRGDDAEALPETAERLFRKAGFDVIYPKRLAELCCGQPFESKGLVAAADRKAAELETVLREASENGRWPIVFDTSPCAYRMKRYLDGRLAVQDCIEFIHDTVLSRVAVEPTDTPVAIHPVCSVRKMGTVDKLAGHRVPVQQQGRAGRRCSLLRLCRRKGLQPSRAERIRAPASEIIATGGMHRRLFVKPHLRDRSVRASRLSVSLDHHIG